MMTCFSSLPLCQGRTLTSGMEVSLSNLTSGARVLHPFVMCGQTFLGVAYRYRTKTVLYRFSALGQLTKYQELSNFGAIDMTSFEYKGHSYLGIANFGNNQRNIKSTVYKWIQKECLIYIYLIVHLIRSRCSLTLLL